MHSPRHLTFQTTVNPPTVCPFTISIIYCGLECWMWWWMHLHVHSTQLTLLLSDHSILMSTVVWNDRCTTCLFWPAVWNYGVNASSLPILNLNVVITDKIVFEHKVIDQYKIERCCSSGGVLHRHKQNMNTDRAMIRANTSATRKLCQHFACLKNNKKELISITTGCHLASIL